METNKSRERTVDDVLEEALRYRGFWGEKGGITVSGGEALLQIDFLFALFTKAQELGIHCTLDTCALPFRNTPRYLEKFDRLMAVTDLVLLDIKEINDEPVSYTHLDVYKRQEMVMELTQKIVESHDLTALMITHDMNHAIEYGNRLIMLYQGKIVVDVKGEEKKNLTVEDLMRLFQQNSGETLVSDELVLG